MSDDPKSFIKTPKQLVIVVLLAFAVPIALFGLVSQLVTGVKPAGREEAETGVLNRIKPVGEVTLIDTSAPQGTLSGEQVYQTVCKACHEAGLVGAPKMGDRAAWAPRIKKGVDALFASALKGTSKGMPPKGGDQNLTDVEVESGVVYMANHSGASFKEPPVPAAAGAATVAAATPAAAAAPAAAPPAASAAGAATVAATAPAAAAANATGGGRCGCAARPQDGPGDDAEVWLLCVSRRRQEGARPGIRGRCRQVSRRRWRAREAHAEGEVGRNRRMGSDSHAPQHAGARRRYQGAGKLDPLPEEITPGSVVSGCGSPAQRPALRQRDPRA